MRKNCQKTKTERSAGPKASETALKLEVESESGNRGMEYMESGEKLLHTKIMNMHIHTYTYK